MILILVVVVLGQCPAKTEICVRLCLYCQNQNYMFLKINQFVTLVDVPIEWNAAIKSHINRLHVNICEAE